jgi:four helix bundle protein
MKLNDYKKLIVWQKSMDLTAEIYSLVTLLPKEETYGLSDQMRRAVISIPSNIAEGRGRLYRKEFLQFVSISRGSLYEVETQLEICERLNYFDQTKTDKAKSLIAEISKMLNALAVSLETK